METIAHVLGYDQVFTNIDFIHIPTVPLEEQPGTEKMPTFKLRSNNGPSDLDTTDVIEGVKARQDNLHPNLWRQFTQSEEMLLKDILFSPISVDGTTIFGVRPPELCFIRKQRDYFRWFHRVPIKLKKCETLNYVLHQNIHPKYGETLWIDGVNN